MPKSALNTARELSPTDEGKTIDEILPAGMIPESLRGDYSTDDVPTVDSLEDAAALVKPTEIISLPNGYQVMRRPKIAGRVYFDFVRESQKSTDAGFLMMMTACFVRVDNGKPLTISEIEDEDGIGFEGVATLAEEVIELFPAARAKLKSSQLLKSATPE